MQAILVQRIGERTHHVGLADDLLEVARAPFARENLVTHWKKPGSLAAAADYTRAARARR
jgi:hypothetical protein